MYSTKSFSDQCSLQFLKQKKKKAECKVNGKHSHTSEIKSYTHELLEQVILKNYINNLCLNHINLTLLNMQEMSSRAPEDISEPDSESCTML